ncbi:hypothetical protein Tco_0652222 [Tanacetum coccineum]|uniref:Uncharacterized protein n=1 Tax=Tanacetum coccineum TaxID=301880 RepID=A0ABQ4WX75_9ASTR
MAFGGNTRELGTIREETDEIMDLHQFHEEILFSEHGDGVASIKRRCRDPSGDGVRELVTASGRGRLKDAEGDLRKFSDIGAWDDMVRVQVPRCMAWLDYDEHVDSLSMMDNEVGVTSPESSTQTLPSFEEYTPPMTYLEEVEKTLGTPIEIEPLNKTKLEEVGVYCNHNTSLSSREVPSFDGPEPQPLLNIPSLDMFDNYWGLESKEVFPLGEELSLFDRPNEVERGRILEAHRLELILQQQISQCMAHSHHNDVYRYYHSHLNSSVGEPSPLSVN